MLYEAIKATFDNRELAYNANLQLFNDDFCTDEVRLKRWEVFLKKIQWKESLSFANVMAVITVRLKGLYDRYWEYLSHYCRLGRADGLSLKPFHDKRTKET